MNIQMALVALEKAAAAILKTVEDVKNFTLSELPADVVNAEAAVEAAIGPVMAEAAVAAQVAEGKVSLVGAALKELHLGSSGPNLESSLEVNPGSNQP